MKILVLTGYCGPRFEKAGLISSTTKFNYATKHGYDFLLLNSSYQDYKDPVSWFKIEWLRDNLKNYDWVFWSDADALIMNQNIKLEDLINFASARPSSLWISPVRTPIQVELPELVEKNYIIAYDDYSPCMGNFLIKNSAWSHEFLNKILSLKQKYLNDDIWDNRSQDFLLYSEKDLLKYIDFVPQKALNSGIHQYTDGDFVLHWYATAEKWRLEAALELSLTDIRLAKKHCLSPYGVDKL